MSKLILVKKGNKIKFGGYSKKGTIDLPDEMRGEDWDKWMWDDRAKKIVLDPDYEPPPSKNLIEDTDAITSVRTDVDFIALMNLPNDKAIKGYMAGKSNDDLIEIILKLLIRMSKATGVQPGAGV